MKKLLLISLLLLAACSSENNTPQIPNNNSEQQTSQDITKNSRWFGVYEGEIPCTNTNCDSIKMRLTLNNDKTYTLIEKYQSNQLINNVSKTVGTFSIDTNNPSLIILDETVNNRIFFIGENFVEIRETKKGNQAKNNSNYTLKKVPD